MAIANIGRDGIAYGVVSMNSLQEWVFDEFFHSGVNVTELEIAEDFDANWEAEENQAYIEWQAENPGYTAKAEENWEAEREDIDAARERFFETLEIEEPSYTLETAEGLQLALGWLGGAPLVWVIDSPETTVAPACSPCVPNAGDLDNRAPRGSHDFAGVICFDLPADWYLPSDASVAYHSGAERYQFARVYRWFSRGLG